ncbi:MAG: cation-binding protein [Frankiales bacterium]|nr:cation-binding protein [Frankiales bacterium]
MDITDLVLEDHHRQRRLFAILDGIDREDRSSLAAVWSELADFLEVHAAAEEKVLYPAVLALSDPDASETKDAIGDHNDIRDAVGRASQCEVGSDDWWEAVGAARAANTEHKGEEEDEVLPHFRAHADLTVRDEIGRAFEVAKTRRLDLSDKEPEEYVEEHST